MDPENHAEKVIQPGRWGALNFVRGNHNFTSWFCLCLCAWLSSVSLHLTAWQLTNSLLNTITILNMAGLQQGGLLTNDVAAYPNANNRMFYQFVQSPVYQAFLSRVHDYDFYITDYRLMLVLDTNILSQSNWSLNGAYPGAGCFSSVAGPTNVSTFVYWLPGISDTTLTSTSAWIPYQNTEILDYGYDCSGTYSGFSLYHTGMFQGQSDYFGYSVGSGSAYGTNYVFTDLNDSLNPTLQFFDIRLTNTYNYPPTNVFLGFPQIDISTNFFVGVFCNVKVIDGYVNYYNTSETRWWPGIGDLGVADCYVLGCNTNSSGVVTNDSSSLGGDFILQHCPAQLMENNNFWINVMPE